MQELAQLGIQLLGENFYAREHTKPLFNLHRILTLKNLYTYHTYMEASKILKFRDPIAVYEQFTLSSRKQTLLIPKVTGESFISRWTKIWNTLTPKLKLTDFSYKISSTKNSLKNSLLQLQNSNDPIAWTSADFEIERLEL